MTTVAWRGIFTVAGTVALLLFLRPPDGRRSWRPTTPHLFAGALFAAASVLVIIAAGPLIASVLGRVFLHQRAEPRTWFTGIAVVAGLAVIVGGSIGQGDVDGDLLALAGATCFAGYLTVSRAARPADMTPAIAVGGVGAALIGLLAGADPGIGGRDLLLLALLGIVILPVSLTLITRATHHVAAPEVNLVALLETLLGPLWVWLAMGERPSGEVLAGGLLVVGAVTIHSALALRADRDEDTPAGVIA